MIFEIEFTEECTSKVKIKADTLEKAKKIVNSGDFSGDEIIERDHFQITRAYPIKEDKNDTKR